MNSESIRQLAERDARSGGDEPWHDRLARGALFCASAPAVVFWGGEHAVLHGSPAVCQKIPLRAWVWASREHVDGGPRIRLSPDPNDHILFDHAANAGRGGFAPLKGVERSSFTEWGGVRRAVDYLSQWAERRGLGSNLKLRTFHELSPGSGCNWSGAFSSAAVAAVMASLHLLQSADVSSWRADAATSEDEGTLGNFHRLAWKMESILHDGRASGYGTLCSVIRTPGPVLYWTAARGIEGSAAPIDVSADPDVLDRVPFFLRSLASLVSQPIDLGDLPLTVGLVPSGLPKSTGAAVRMTERFTQDYAKAMDGPLGDLIRGEELRAVRRSNPRLDGIASGKMDAVTLRNEQVFSLGTSALWVAESLLLLLAGEAGVEGLAEAMRRAEGGLAQLGLDRGAHDETHVVHVAAAIYRWARTHHLEAETAVKMTGGGRGGQLFFVTGQTNNIPSLDGYLEAARSSEFLNSETIRMSWLSDDDGFDGTGLALNHGPAQGGIFSS